MRNKFIKILKELGFELVNFKYHKPNFDWNWYEISYKNANGDEFLWDGETDNWDKDENSISSRVGILKLFKKDVSKNC